MSVPIKEFLRIEKDRWFSARDISQKYGKSHQYWSRLLNNGTIRAEETSAGMITTQSWIDDYLASKRKIRLKKMKDDPREQIRCLGKATQGLQSRKKG